MVPNCQEATNQPNLFFFWMPCNFPEIIQNSRHASESLWDCLGYPLRNWPTLGTIPSKGSWEDEFPFPVGYVSVPWRLPMTAFSGEFLFLD